MSTLAVGVSAQEYIRRDVLHLFKYLTAWARSPAHQTLLGSTPTQYGHRYSRLSIGTYKLVPAFGRFRAIRKV